MIWQKEGLIFKVADYRNDWINNSALTPTPLQITDKIIRVFVSFRDDKGRGRIGYVDVDSRNPKDILKVSSIPLLDIGAPGSFDDNGLILGEILRVGKELYLYYVGFQLAENVKFLAFTGLAISNDNGEHFSKYSSIPVLDRREDAWCINAIHSIRYENNTYYAWTGSGKSWVTIDGKQYPSYNIRLFTSANGIEFRKESILCIDNNLGNQEYRIGRPRVYKYKGVFEMYFTYGTLDRRYMMGYAYSQDGIHWERRDDTLGMTLSKGGWDSLHLCYGSLITVDKKTYMFYNGNNMGYDGFGYAELVEE